MQKRRMASALLFASLCSKTLKKKTNFSELQPTPIMTYCCTILGMCTDLFNWRFQLNKDFNFAGGLTPNLNKLFEQCAKKHGLVCGAGAGRQILKNVRTSKDLCIDVFHEDEPRQHLMKVGAVLGAFFGFHGGKEHSDLLVKHLQVGMFEVGRELEGTE
jgi:hypothetical protein